MKRNQSVGAFVAFVTLTAAAYLALFKCIVDAVANLWR